MGLCLPKPLPRPHGGVKGGRRPFTLPLRPTGGVAFLRAPQERLGKGLAERADHERRREAKPFPTVARGGRSLAGQGPAGVLVGGTPEATHKPGCGGGQPPFGCRRRPNGRGGEGGALSVAAAVARPTQGGRRPPCHYPASRVVTGRGTGPPPELRHGYTSPRACPRGGWRLPVRGGRGTAAIRDWRGSLGASLYAARDTLATPDDHHQGKPARFRERNPDHATA